MTSLTRNNKENVKWGQVISCERSHTYQLFWWIEAGNIKEKIDKNYRPDNLYQEVIKISCLKQAIKIYNRNHISKEILFGYDNDIHNFQHPIYINQYYFQ